MILVKTRARLGSSNLSKSSSSLRCPWSESSDGLGRTIIHVYMAEEALDWPFADDGVIESEVKPEPDGP